MRSDWGKAGLDHRKQGAMSWPAFSLQQHKGDYFVNQTKMIGGAQAKGRKQVSMNL